MVRLPARRARARSLSSAESVSSSAYQVSRTTAAAATAAARNGHCGAIGRGEDAAEGGAEDEAKAESGEDVAQALGAFFARRDVSDVCLRYDDIAAGDPIQDAGKEEPAKAGREGQHDKADDRPDLTDDQNRNPSVMIGQAADIWT